MLLIKKMLNVFLLMALLFSISLTIYASGFFNNNTEVISHTEKWFTPFESATTTVYDLGDGLTSTLTTTTNTTIISVKHSDKRLFSTEQWNEILRGIADGDIVWED